MHEIHLHTNAILQMRKEKAAWQKAREAFV
jgi:hypothetical protein